MRINFEEWFYGSLCVYIIGIVFTLPIGLMFLIGGATPKPWWLYVAAGILSIVMTIAILVFGISGIPYIRQLFGAGKNLVGWIVTVLYALYCYSVASSALIGLFESFFQWNLMIGDGPLLSTEIQRMYFSYFCLFLGLLGLLINSFFIKFPKAESTSKD